MPINQIQDLLPESIPLPDSESSSDSEASLSRNIQYVNLQQLTQDLFIASDQQFNQNTPINIEEMTINNILRTILSAHLPADQELRGEDNWITWYSSILALFKLFELENIFY